MPKNQIEILLGFGGISGIKSLQAFLINFIAVLSFNRRQIAAFN